MAIESEGDNRMANAFSSFASAATRRHLALLYDYWKKETNFRNLFTIYHSSHYHHYGPT